MPDAIDIIDGHVALGEEHYLHLDESELLRRLDTSGIALAIARPLGADIAVHNRRGNERLLRAGPRIRALITANPWYGVEALDEIKRCRDLGAVGLYLHPTRQGFMPTDPIVQPLVELANRLRWPVVFHTGAYIQSDVLAVAELARRFPETNFICDNAGFTDMWFELPGLLADNPNLLLCASLIWPRAIANTIRDHGAGRILFGSGEPRDRIDAALRRISALDLHEADRRAILHENAARIFSLSPRGRGLG